MPTKCICSEGRACCPIHDNPHMEALRITAQQREHNNLVRRLVFKARDLSFGISKCESPEEMARCFSYIQSDADELGRIATELLSSPAAPKPIDSTGADAARKE